MRENANVQNVAIGAGTDPAVYMHERTTATWRPQARRCMAGDNRHNVMKNEASIMIQRGT